MCREYLDAIKGNRDYTDFLSLMGSLSNLFADSTTPFIHYRIVENLFCKCFEAENLARFDDSYDAKKWEAGIGLKTFILPPGGTSSQKVAEFDSLSPRLRGLSAPETAALVSGWRNRRIATADSLHGITQPSFYHVVGRQKGMLKLFVTEYDAIRTDRLVVTGETAAGISFSDGLHDYSFNRSKNTLMARFVLPPEERIVNVPVRIDADPFESVRRLMDNPLGKGIVRVENGRIIAESSKIKEEAVVLPLFSTRERGEVSAKSGLNQWNAKGRARDPDEVYIPVPMRVHELNPGFFPECDVVFALKLPNGTTLSAKMCQQGRKGLMSNPNRALGRWILRDVLHIPPWRVVTREMLDASGFDSVVVVREAERLYRLELSRAAHYLEGTSPRTFR